MGCYPSVVRGFLIPARSSTEHAVCQTLYALRDRVTVLAISHQSRIAAVADVAYELRDGARTTYEAVTV
jgi:ABC-type transport system involved in cytochrome bd biosynthesis fused ATPase/permease subunit